MDCYMVAIREKKEDGKAYTLLLEKTELAELLLHLDDEKYELGEIICTYSEKHPGVIPFCKIDKNLETGDKEGENK